MKPDYVVPSLQQPYRQFSVTDKISSDIDRGFRVLGIQQIAIGAPDKSNLTTLWHVTQLHLYKTCRVIYCNSKSLHICSITTR